MAHKEHEIYSEDELISRQKNDDYLVKKVVKFTVLFLVVAVLVFLTANLLFEYLNNDTVKRAINDVIIENFSAIILAALYILGYNFIDRKLSTPQK